MCSSFCAQKLNTPSIDGMLGQGDDGGTVGSCLLGALSVELRCFAGSSRSFLTMPVCKAC